MSPIEIPELDFSLPLPDFDINIIGSYILTVWELVNQNSLITTTFLLLTAVALVGMIFRLVTNNRGQGFDEEEYRR